MHKYLLIKVSDIDTSIIKDFFFDLINQRIEVIEEGNVITIKYVSNEAYELEDIVNTLNTELLCDVLLFSSNSFLNVEDLETNLSLNKTIFKNIQSSAKYFDEKILAKNALMITCKKDVKKLVLGKYYDDVVMIEILRTFFKCNLNASLTSKRLYMHRNTLLNKLDKFIKDTGYDVKDFNEAYILYTIINS